MGSIAVTETFAVRFVLFFLWYLDLRKLLISNVIFVNLVKSMHFFVQFSAVWGFCMGKTYYFYSTLTDKIEEIMSVKVTSKVLLFWAVVHWTSCTSNTPNS